MVVDIGSLINGYTWALSQQLPVSKALMNVYTKLKRNDVNIIKRSIIVII